MQRWTDRCTVVGLWSIALRELLIQSHEQLCLSLSWSCSHQSRYAVCGFVELTYGFAKRSRRSVRNTSNASLCFTRSQKTPRSQDVPSDKWGVDYSVDRCRSCVGCEGFGAATFGDTTTVCCTPSYIKRSRWTNEDVAPLRCTALAQQRPIFRSGAVDDRLRKLKIFAFCLYIIYMIYLFTFWFLLSWPAPTNLLFLKPRVAHCCNVGHEPEKKCNSTIIVVNRA